MTVGKPRKPLNTLRGIETNILGMNRGGTESPSRARKPLNTLRGIETFGPRKPEDGNQNDENHTRKPLNTLRGIETNNIIVVV